MATFLSIAQAVALDCDEADITTLATPTEDYIKKIKNYINMGYKIAYRSIWGNDTPRLKSTLAVSASPTSLSSTSIEAIEKLWVTGFSPINLMSADRFFHLFNDTTVSGQPSEACIVDSNLYLYPVPDSSYSLNYVAKHSYADLSADGDIPLVDGDILTNYAKYKLYSTQMDPRAQGAYQDFMQAVETFKNLCYSNVEQPKSIKNEDFDNLEECNGTSGLTI